MEHEFEISGIVDRFRVGRLDVFKQAALAAKIAPLVVPFAKMAKDDGLLAKLAELSANEEQKNSARSEMIDAFLGNVEALTEAFREYPEEDLRFIMETCFKAVSRKPADAVGWQSIWNDQNHRLQYQDIDNLPAAFTIIGQVIAANLKNFF